ncbi:protein lethal(2)essential for life-like [Pollicipes pollicipes]|uniref:protein lethal(2)essential for life-like n=1 Tax=Pollicipes pollicipes TaxID=41117 RepID=UPI0018856C71|nr:protein lethal(2)essential for life-like [Pollicipes pollicipes]
MAYWLGPWMGLPLLADVHEKQVQDQEKPEKFQVSMHLGHYEPDEVVVKVSDNVITVRAEHEEKSKNSYSFSSTVRQITAPEDARVDQLTSQLTSSGHLKLEAPLAQKPLANGVRNIPITIEGPARNEEKKEEDPVPLRITYNVDKDDGDKKH